MIPCKPSEKVPRENFWALGLPPANQYQTRTTIWLNTAPGARAVPRTSGARAHRGAHLGSNDNHCSTATAIAKSAPCKIFLQLNVAILYNSEFQRIMSIPMSQSSKKISFQTSKTLTISTYRSDTFLIQRDTVRCSDHPRTKAQNSDRQ